MLNVLKRKFQSLLSDKKFSEILTGSAWALGARVISTGFAMIASIIVARFYGAEMVGIVAILNSFLLLVTIFTVLGTETSILRLIPEHLVKYSYSSAFKLYRKTQYMVIGVSLASGTLFFFGSHFIADKVFSKPHLSFYFSLATIFVVFKSIMLLNSNAVRGLRLIKVFAVMQFLPQGLNLLFLILLGIAWSTQDIPVYAMLGGFALTGLSGWMIMEYVFKKKMHPQDVIQPLKAREILAISLPMLMTTSMTFVIGQAGVLFLGMFHPENEVGYYSIAVKLATLTTFILTSINAMAAPKFSELFHKGNLDELFYVAQKSAKLIFWATMPILIILIAAGKPILHLLYGRDFKAAYSPMFLLVIGQFVNSISGSTGYFMNMTGNHRQYRNIMVTTAILNIILNLSLIPKFGTLGAAITAMTCMVFWNLSALFYIKKTYGKMIGYVPLYRSIKRW